MNNNLRLLFIGNNIPKLVVLPNFSYLISLYDYFSIFEIAIVSALPIRKKNHKQAMLEILTIHSKKNPKFLNTPESGTIYETSLNWEIVNNIARIVKN